MRENTKFGGLSEGVAKGFLQEKGFFISGIGDFHIRKSWIFGMKNQGSCWFWESWDFHIRNHVKQKSGASVYCQVALDTNYCFLRHPMDFFSLVSMMEKGGLFLEQCR
jgi:hypothetical protein